MQGLLSFGAFFTGMAITSMCLGNNHWQIELPIGVAFIATYIFARILKNRRSKF